MDKTKKIKDFDLIIGLADAKLKDDLKSELNDAQRDIHGYSTLKHFQEFASTWTVHGPIHILKKELKRWKVLWTFLCIIAFACGCQQCYSVSLIYFYSNNVASQILVNQASEMTFPAVTLCNMNSFRIIKLWRGIYDDNWYPKNTIENLFKEIEKLRYITSKFDTGEVYKYDTHFTKSNYDDFSPYDMNIALLAGISDKKIQKENSKLNSGGDIIWYFTNVVKTEKVKHWSRSFKRSFLKAELGKALEILDELERDLPGFEPRSNLDDITAQTILDILYFLNYKLKEDDYLFRHRFIIRDLWPLAEKLTSLIRKLGGDSFTEYDKFILVKGLELEIYLKYFIYQGDPYSCSDGKFVDEFRCDNGDRCIPYEWKCDYTYFDCNDNHDEWHCNNPYSCKHGIFNNELKCDGGNKCFPHEWACDNKLDCADGHDEFSCSKHWDFNIYFLNAMEGQDLQYRAQVVDKKGNDLERIWYINNVVKSEKDDPYSCEDGYFVDEISCDNGTKCIPNEWKCDFIYFDCEDRSDESHCENYLPYSCDDGFFIDEFSCDNGTTCIPSKWQCDIYVDCEDKSDEYGCGMCN